MTDRSSPPAREPGSEAALLDWGQSERKERQIPQNGFEAQNDVEGHLGAAAAAAKSVSQSVSQSPDTASDLLSRRRDVSGWMQVQRLRCSDLCKSKLSQVSSLRTLKEWLKALIGNRNPLATIIIAKQSGVH